MIATALMALLAGFMHVGFCLFAQSVLDQAAAGVARQFWTGKNQGAVYSDGIGGTAYNPNNADFKTNSVCPQLAGILDCNAVQVINYPVNDYQGMTDTTKPDPGGSKTTMVLKLVYTAPIPVWPVLNSSGGSSPMLITSIIPYVNEY